MENVYNYVRLQGFLQTPNLSKTPNGHDRFQGKVAVPFTFRDRATGEEKEGHKYFKISAWAEVARELGGLPEGTPLVVEGELSERNYDSSCTSCASPLKKFWSEVTVRKISPVE